MDIHSLLAKLLVPRIYQQESGSSSLSNPNTLILLRYSRLFHYK